MSLTVGDLREAIEDQPDDMIVLGVEFGYRSSNVVDMAECGVFEDDRENDDWGNSKESGDRLYILLGGTASNRYPPSSVRQAWD